MLSLLLKYKGNVKELLQKLKFSDNLKQACTTYCCDLQSVLMRPAKWFHAIM